MAAIFSVNLCHIMYRTETLIVMFECEVYFEHLMTLFASYLSTLSVLFHMIIA